MAVIRKVRDFFVLLCMLVLGLLIAAKLERQQVSTFAGPFFVVDGDTLSFAGERLRLSGIDAPEIDQACRRDGHDWRCGADARDALQELLRAGDAVCEGSGRDKYRRLLVSCTGKGGDVGAALVRQGLAMAYGRYDREQHDAMTGRKGLWAGTFDRPQDFRREHGQAVHDQGFAWLSRLIDWLFGANDGGDDGHEAL